MLIVFPTQRLAFANPEESESCKDAVPMKIKKGRETI